MSTKNEELHLNECVELIKKNVSLYEKQVEDRHREYLALYKAVQSGNVELYDQLFTAQSLEEHAVNQLNKNKAALDKPFFGRIDYANLDERINESIYIGKHGVQRNKTDVVIVDWRAPISTVYYENEIGRGSYSIPDGRSYSIDLKLKRTYDVENGKLNGYYDSDVAANDELLVKYLSKNRDAVLGDIIATIQKEQNNIIRANPFHNIIVQGVAGSGKTTVAMHRISYIMYNYKDRFTSNEFCIVGGSNILIDYITGGLPELEVYDVKHKTMDELLIYLLKKQWKKNYRLIPVDIEFARKSKLSFILCLEDFLAAIKNQMLGNCEVYDDDLGMLLSRKNNETFIGNNPELSINKLLLVLDERLRKRIIIASQGHEIEGISKKKQQQYKGLFSSHQIKTDVTVIYRQFLAWYSEAYNKDMSAVIENNEKGLFDVYDIACLNLINYRIFQKKPDEEFGQIFIDEAQDFGAAVYYVYRTILPECFFTIMGDVSQNVNYECGLNDWRDMTQKIFNSDTDEFRLLCKSYRNTIEISNFAGKILDRASRGTYKIEPVIRHGKEVEYISAADVQVTCDKVLDAGYETVAIICFDEDEANNVHSLLRNKGLNLTKERTEGVGSTKGIKVLTVKETKGLEFDSAILWKPDLTGYGDNPKLAKQMYVAATRALHELYIAG